MFQRSIVLASETDFAGFRREARALLAQGVPPHEVDWFTPAPGATPTLPGLAATPAAASETAVRLSLPPALMTTLQQAALHDDPLRFALLYRLVWRLQHEPGLRHDPLDADVVAAQRMAQAVRRDMHKAKAFVRFRTDDDGGDAPLHVAWFQPFHHIVEAVAPFFARRFTGMRWALLTPRGCAHWEPDAQAAGGGRLRLAPPASAEDAPAPDAGEALWLTYYRHIFNPARLKLDMMQREMPRKYWPLLPEAALIAPLASEAGARGAAMLAREPEVARRTVRLLPARTVPTVIASLDDLRAATQRCRECPIGEHATQAVCGEGPQAPRLMVVGEQPGDQEDLQGRPFVGPSGQLFDRALAQLGLDRDSMYITNAVRHFKYELRGKRRIHKTPGQREAMACHHWLDDEIRLVQPQALVALGATAVRALLGDGVSVTKDRGQWFRRAEDGLPVLVTLHPSALLRAVPEARAEAFDAWLADLRRMAEPAPARSAPPPTPINPPR